jgi:hypothetical protein
MADVIQFKPKPLPLEQVWDADKVWSGEQTAPTYRSRPESAPSLASKDRGDQFQPKGPR